MQQMSMKQLKKTFKNNKMLGFRLILYSVCDSVMHLCPFCNRRTINLLDDDDDDENAVKQKEIKDSLVSFVFFLFFLAIEIFQKIQNKLKYFI